MAKTRLQKSATNDRGCCGRDAARSGALLRATRLLSFCGVHVNDHGVTQVADARREKARCTLGVREAAAAGLRGAALSRRLRPTVAFKISGRKRPVLPNMTLGAQHRYLNTHLYDRLRAVALCGRPVRLLPTTSRLDSDPQGSTNAKGKMRNNASTCPLFGVHLT